MHLWLKLILVGVASAIGALCRYGIEQALRTVAMGIWIGLSNWIINCAACFLMGIFAGWLVVSPWGGEYKTAFTLLAMTGFCGGFSTFSEFTLDCIEYFMSGHAMAWLVYMGATIFVGLICCALGYWLGQRL